MTFGQHKNPGQHLEGVGLEVLRSTLSTALDIGRFWRLLRWRGAEGSKAIHVQTDLWWYGNGGGDLRQRFPRDLPEISMKILLKMIRYFFKTDSPTKMTLKLGWEGWGWGFPDPHIRRDPEIIRGNLAAVLDCEMVKSCVSLYMFWDPKTCCYKKVWNFLLTCLFNMIGTSSSLSLRFVWWAFFGMPDLKGTHIASKICRRHIRHLYLEILEVSCVFLFGGVVKWNFPNQKTPIPHLTSVLGVGCCGGALVFVGG